MPLAAAEQTQFTQLVQVDETYREVNQVVTTYELAGIKKGMEKGREEGREEGMAKGKREALLLLMESRFAELPAEVRRKVERIKSSQRIDELFLAALNAKSLSELGL